MRKLIFTIALMLVMDFGIADMLMPSLRQVPNPANDVYSDSDTIEQFNDGEGVLGLMFNDLRV